MYSCTIQERERISAKEAHQGYFSENCYLSFSVVTEENWSVMSFNLVFLELKTLGPYCIEKPSKDQRSIFPCCRALHGQNSWAVKSLLALSEETTIQCKSDR
jgi:hypothetical protein